MNKRHVARTLWVTAAAVVCVLSFWLSRTGSGADNDEADFEGAQVQVPDASALRQPLSVTAYQDVTARPLFRSDRRPPIKKAAGSILDDWYITGVVRTGARQIVLLRNNKARKSTRVRLGEDLQGWTLTDLTDDQASFRKDDATVTLTRKD